MFKKYFELDFFRHYSEETVKNRRSSKSNITTSAVTSSMGPNKNH